MVCPQGKGTADALDLRRPRGRRSESVSLESGLAKTWPTEMKGVDLATENEIGVVWGSKDLAKFLESRHDKKKKKHFCAREKRGP